YERPFLWGSKRTGPDLHRVGGRFSDAWHRAHLLDPRRVVPGSVMPAYPWLATRQVDTAALQSRMRALRVLGHPYTDADLTAAANIAATEMDALIAYLQSLGAGAAQ
ncbi:MAG: cbb3-type cytochrome c oxidase subunit II, partial [Gammaproteobacteria bacterium]|nr:cbb3-type cytochrome c oxidase subunit II [Gammaproteobacteria bacterium]